MVFQAHQEFRVGLANLDTLVTQGQASAATLASQAILVSREPALTLKGKLQLLPICPPPETKSMMRISLQTMAIYGSGMDQLGLMPVRS